MREEEHVLRVPPLSVFKNARECKEPSASFFTRDLVGASPTTGANFKTTTVA